MSADQQILSSSTRRDPNSYYMHFEVVFRYIPDIEDLKKEQTYAGYFHVQFGGPFGIDIKDKGTSFVAKWSCWSQTFR